MTDSSDRTARVKKIAAILVEESVATHLPFELGVQLDKEAEVIEMVRASPNGINDLPGYMVGVAPRADPENVARAVQRIIAEVT